MKRQAWIFVTMLLIVGWAVCAAVAFPDPTIYVDGRQLALDVPAQFDNGTTLVPVRPIFEALGATVTWDEASQTVTAVKAGTEIKLTIGQTTAYRNGTAITLSSPPQFIADRTLVPLRFVSEAFGAQVNWDQAQQQITINSLTQSDGKNPPAPASPGSKVVSFWQQNVQLLVLLGGLLLLVIGGLSGLRFVKRFKSSRIIDPKEIKDPIEARYQAGIRAIETNRWTDANLALVSLSLDKYKDAETLWNYAVAREQYDESRKMEAADPYWAGYMADYCSRNIPDDYDGIMSEEILQFKTDCQINLSNLENDPVAQMKHQQAEERQKKLPPNQEQPD